jgi:hypothetical protein
MSFLPDSAMNRIRLAPDEIVAVYAQYREQFLDLLDPPEISEGALKAAFCSLVAHDAAPYGPELPTYDLVTMLNEPTLACDAYVALTWQLAHLLDAELDSEIAMGWNYGVFGDHAQFLVSADGTNLLLDPTFGFVVYGVTLGGLINGVRYTEYASLSDRVDRATHDLVLGAITDGLYRASDAYYAFSSFDLYESTRLSLGRQPLFAPPQRASDNFGSSDGYPDQASAPRLVGDVNGDGYADVIALGATKTYVALGKGDGTFLAAVPAAAAFTAAFGWTSQESYPRALADVDGDGRADLVGFGATATYVQLARPDGTFAPWQMAVAAFGPNGGWTDQDRRPRQLADVDGDGRADIVGFGRAGVYVALATGGGHFATPMLVLAAFNDRNGWTSQDAYPRLLGDVNGDGRADIVGFGAAGVYVSLATGAGRFAAPIMALPHDLGALEGWTSQDETPRLLGDVNDDGMADIVGFGSQEVYGDVNGLNGIRVALAAGDGLFDPGTLDLIGFAADAASGGWASQDQYPRFLADTNGDGQSDIVGFGHGGTYVSLVESTRPPIPLSDTE